MRRDQLILLLQPYKNGLMPKKELGDSIDRFARTLLGLCEKHPRLRFNIALPGYILESIDPLVASQLREPVKRGSLEWLCMGYTEPFQSFSPLWLTGENIAHGARVFEELTGEAPTGFAPPFSNWEPSHIDLYCGAGMRYAAISSVLLAGSEADSAGYWITEYTGNSMAVFPARSHHIRNAPESVMEWIKDTFPDDKSDGAPRMIVLKYLYPLESEDRGGDAGKSGGERRPPQDPREKIEQIAAEIDKHILELQPLRFKDALGNIPPLGLYYFPPSLVPAHSEPATPYFLNHLHCHDQISVMQRKMMDACVCVREIKDSKLGTSLKRQLFFAQDINRYLPSEKSGFTVMPDRLWTYGKMIDIEREIYGLRDVQNGVIRLGDFLRNGYKSVIMSNRGMKIYLDHKNGAQIYALDYGERSYNAFAAYNPLVRARPHVIVPRESRLGFRDRIFTRPVTLDDYRKGVDPDCSNFSDSQFEYIFKNTPSGVKVHLNCNGGFIDDDRQCPLSMDKVFGLEKDGAVLSYSYKLCNTSLTDYSFTFGTELPLALPGSSTGGAQITGGKKKAAVNDTDPVIIDDVTEWEIDDEEIGVRMEFVSQKKVSVWLFPADAPANRDKSGANGTILFISCPIELEKNSTISLTGMIKFKKIRARSAHNDSL